MKIKLLILLCSAFVFLNACNQNPELKVDTIRYEFKEPTQFPFEVNDVSTNIDLEAPDFLHQFIFHYRNIETTQQINYILSKVLEKPEKVSNDNMTEYKLENGVLAFYEEGETSQSLWWETEDGFLARYIYFINGNTTELGEYKLEIDELIKLANEVQ
ncbi:hypothetical protein [Psychrobacillus sp. BL-248-WT-3]|uniref:hypothetical protein n=1 Tax=Psychrobacillus sp. BL-248-WT-3 TaxID=2725306 RepID=UPI00146DE94B|nr:hypothetical protein [Psychrobacillus sp. BL-248-WT-3]NME07125.1 hypothetical protein [Psychrobacillus sp. BL-248-WT-3]